MYKFNLTIGLFDKNTEKQEISTSDAKDIIRDVIVKSCNLMCTMIECEGCYCMNSTGNVVVEPSIRVEIAHKDDLYDYIKGAAHTLAMYLNQESVMVERCGDGEIDFVG